MLRDINIKMAQSTAKSLEPHPLDKVDQLVQEIYDDYTKLSAYEKTIGKEKQSLRLPVPDKEFWKVCKNLTINC